MGLAALILSESRLCKCAFTSKCICIKIWETLLELQHVVLDFCLTADPRLGGVWTFDLRKHSLAKGLEFLLSAKSISVFIFVQDSAVWRIEAGFKVRILPLQRLRITSHEMGCSVHDEVRDLMRFGCSHLSSGEPESVPASLARRRENISGFSLKMKSLEQSSAVSSLCLWESDTLMIESHLFNLGWRSWTSVLCKHQTACVQQCFCSNISWEDQVNRTVFGLPVPVWCSC